MMEQERSSRLSGWLAVLLGCVFLALLHTHGNFLQRSWFLAVVWLVPVGAGLWWYARSSQGGTASSPEHRAGWILLGACGLYLFSSATLDRWFYFNHWVPSSNLKALLLTGGPAQFMILVALITPLVYLSARKQVRALFLLFLGGQIFCFFRLYQSTGWSPLYRDDHPSFMHRLWQFAQSFPQLPVYDASWNAGTAHIYGLASGTQSIGALLYPLWKNFPIEQVYTFGVGVMFFVVVPWIAMLSVRLCGGSWKAGWAGGLLALGPTQSLFMWVLNFGTLGANSASPFIMLVCACVYLVLWRDRRGLFAALLLVLSTVFFFAWPVSGFMIVPIGVGILASGSAWSRGRIGFLVCCAVLVIVLMVPVVLSIIHFSDVSGFAEMRHRTAPLSDQLLQGWKELLVYLRQAHPLVVFLGLAGVWVLPSKGMKHFFGVTLVLLLALSAWGEIWKPQYQLARVVIPLLYLACIPAACWVGKLLDDEAYWLGPARAALLALLVLSTITTADSMAGKGRIQLHVMNEETQSLVEWIKGYTPPDQRILFAGSSIHGYGAGHVAALPIFTGREMMGSDYYHFSPKRTDYEYPPRPFRESLDGMFTFLEWHNVSHIITYHAQWNEMLGSLEDHFEKVASFGKKLPKNVYRVKGTWGPFVKGHGVVKASVNRIDVEINDPSAPVVIKYNWADGLTVEPPAELRAYDMGKGIQFIEIDPKGERDVSILYKRWY